MYSSPSPPAHGSRSGAMAQYGFSHKQQRPASFPVSFVRWLRKKNYQYEVTFSLYMLTPREKCIFNMILFILVSLFITAASLYFPNHVSIIYRRVWYYIEGSTVSTSFTGAVKTTKAVLSYQTPANVAQQTAAQVLKEL